MTERISKKKNLAGEDRILYEFHQNDGSRFCGIYKTLDEAHKDRDSWLIMKGDKAAALLAETICRINEINPGIPL